MYTARHCPKNKRASWGYKNFRIRLVELL